MRIGPYRLHIAFHAWEWGKELHPFSGDVLIHFGPFHLQRRMLEADYLG